MKKILLTLIALVMSIGISWADKTIYFEPNKWDQNDKTEFFAAYAWGGSSADAWYDAEAVEGTTYYKFTIPDDREGLLFTRAESEADKHTWGAKWNQSNDITEISNNAAYVFTTWGDSYNKSTVVPTTFSPYTVKFATKSNWANVYAYTYGEEATGDWPGKKMTATGEKVYDLSTFTAYNIYSISFLATAAPSNIIFDNGGSGEGNQTGNLEFTNGKFYLDGIQENLAYGTTVTWGDDDDHTEGIQNGTLNNITDGNDGTAFQCNFGDKTVFSVVLDLGEAKTFNSLLINQTGDRWNTAFQIFVSNDNSAWTEVTAKTSGVTSGKFITTFTTETARYVKYYTTKANKNVTDVYGASLAEIQLYNLDAVPTLSSITLSALSTSIVAGYTTTLTATGASSLSGVAIGLGDITWNNDNTTAGTITDGVYTGAAAGTSVVSATVDEITSNTVSITVLAAATEPSTPTIDENKISIYVGDTEHLPTGFAKYRVADYQADGWTRKALEYTSGHNVEFTMNALDVSGMEKIHIDIFPNETTTLALFVNGTSTSWNGYDLNEGNEIPAGAWYSEDIPVSFFTETCSHDMSTLTNMVFCKKVADKTGHAGFYDFSSPYKSFLIGNIYFWKESGDDNEKPVMVSAALASKTHNSATLTLEATDNNSKVKFHIVDATNNINVTTGLADQGTDFEYTVTGLTAETAYNFTVTAEDAAGNVSENNKDVAVTTDAAPTGQELVSGDHKVLLNGYHDIGTENYELIITSDEVMQGLGGSYWNINGVGGTRVDANLVRSADGKTLTITATSNQDPQLYTPLYVMMPGEVNFGQPTIIWQERGAAPTPTEGYYIIGNMNDWEINNNYKLTLNETAAPTVEYYFPSLALTTSSQFKVVYSADGTEKTTNYPDGIGNAYGENGEIASDGNYVIFFRPNADGGADWFYNVIYVTSMIDAGEDPTTGARILTGVWDADKFTSIDAMDKAAAYDLTGVDFTGVATPIDMVGKTANPYSLFITSTPNTVNRNEVVWDATNNRYNGYALNFTEPAGSTAPFDINTSIAPIHVVNPSFQRLFTDVNNYFTMTIPFDYILPETDKAWTMSATSSESGLSVTFTEVAAGSTLTKNTPYLYFSSVGGVTMLDPGEVIIDWAAQTVDETDASFVANYSRKVTDGTENIYVLPGVVKETALQFQKAGEVSIRPFRAYLQAASAPAKINVMIEDTDGIHAATAEQLEGIFNIYSIDGKLVRQNGDKMGLNKGVYIINGKKVVVK